MGEAATDWARKLHLSIRRRVFRRLARTDAELAGFFEKLAPRLRSRLQITHLSEAQVAQILVEEFDRVERQLLPVVERQVRDAAAEGNASAKQLLERLDRIAGRDRADPSRALGSQPKLTLVPKRPSGSGGSSAETD